MTEYVDREAYVKYLASRQAKFIDDYGKGWSNGVAAAKQAATVFPAADVEPVRHGRWVSLRKGDWTSVYKCSLCKRRVTVACDRDKADELVAASYPYCHCGAKMDGKESGGAAFQ